MDIVLAVLVNQLFLFIIVIIFQWSVKFGKLKEKKFRWRERERERKADYSLSHSYYEHYANCTNYAFTSCFEGVIRVVSKFKCYYVQIFLIR